MAKHRKLFSAAVNGTKVQVAVSGVSLGGYHIANLTAALAYIQVFNLPAADVTVGTTVPTLSLPLPASGGATLYLGGLDFDALTLACTTGATNAVSSDAFVVLTLKL